MIIFFFNFQVNKIIKIKNYRSLNNVIIEKKKKNKQYYLILW